MSISQISTKVCIIGASPAGLLIANILQKNRIDCILVEKSSYVDLFANSEFGLIDHKTINLLQEYGLSDRLLQEGIHIGKSEFRTAQQSFVLDYAKICQGQVHYTYPQQELLTDLLQRFEQTGGEVLFNTEVVKMTNNHHGAWLKCQQQDRTMVINCDFIAGCDGFNGLSRASIPETVIEPFSKNFNYSWLAITAEASSSDEHFIYGLHSNGFAGQTLQQEGVYCYYLQIPSKDTVADWSDAKIWSELQIRLAKEGWKIAEGKIIAKKIVAMKQVISQTIQHCRLFLAGNSAHIVTPAGAKSLNLEIQDADVLAKSLIRYYRYHDNSQLKKYSTSRFPEIRQTQQFCESLLHMIESQDGSTIEGKSQQRVQQFKRSQLMNSEIYALDFARKYVGYVKSEKRSHLTKAQSSIAEKSSNVVDFDPNELPPLMVG